MLTKSKRTEKKQKRMVETLIKKEGLKIVTDRYSYWNNGLYVVDEEGEEVFCLSREDVNPIFNCSYMYQIWQLKPSLFLKEFKNLIEAIKEYKKKKNKIINVVDKIEELLEEGF
jgi:hypothetical protein